MKRLNETLTRSHDDDEDFEDDGMSDAGTELDNEPVNGTINPVIALKHVRMYRKLQANWQAYDAYARVCMALGANQLLHAVSYYTLQMLISEESSPFPALACLALLAFCAWLLARLDLYLSIRLRQVAGFLLLAPPA